MRRLAITISIIGAVAFAALLAWGLTFGSGAVQANDASPTPTATVEATETPTAEAEATGTPLPTCIEAGVLPGPPANYEGLVTIDGAAAPAGTELTLTSDSVTWGTATVAAATEGPYAGSANYYNVIISFLPQMEPPCLPPSTVTVICGDTGATDASFEILGAGALATQDIACVGAVVSPTPTPTAEPSPIPSPTVVVTPTPIPTPTVAPPTGMGGMSGDGGGFTWWWPLALAAAALTSVAGLLTARWARR